LWSSRLSYYIILALPVSVRMHLPPSSGWKCYLGDGGIMFFQNFGNYLQDYAVSWYRTVVFNLGYAYPRGYAKTS
jgi:hypothetical protein